MLLVLFTASVRVHTAVEACISPIAWLYSAWNDADDCTSSSVLSRLAGTMSRNAPFTSVNALNSSSRNRFL